ncbi:hypothetical protein AAFF_G00216300 [Aldrovandia affinis]|uniref:Uncharacterized protein n=1 Tax=Aldrovandia affinis TaxID=143900 RepID=A0AAD7RGE4_9TELE|nr:hypothetical protein AAFF_G00216300 [Aldrovandia affinis]
MVECCWTAASSSRSRMVHSPMVIERWGPRAVAMILYTRPLSWAGLAWGINVPALTPPTPSSSSVRRVGPYVPESAPAPPLRAYTTRRTPVDFDARGLAVPERLLLLPPAAERSPNVPSNFPVSRIEAAQACESARLAVVGVRGARSSTANQSERPGGSHRAVPETLRCSSGVAVPGGQATVSAPLKRDCGGRGRCGMPPSADCGAACRLVGVRRSAAHRGDALHGE